MFKWPYQNFRAKHLFVSAIILGIFIRLNVYFQNRSLVLDEANLARNIVERNLLDFFKPLDYDQYAPPFFSMFSKFSINIFGINEFALKLIPLLAGIISIILLFMILNRILENNILKLYVLLLFIFSDPIIRYSTEFKQYSTDQLFALLLIFLALVQQRKAFNMVTTFVWAIIGSIAIWFSMPSIFILTSIFGALLVKTWKKDGISLYSVFIIGTC